jgi:two-component system chemotaxis sensor kinase CheA
VADQKGMSFSVELGPNIPPTIATDPRRLRQVLKNLIANAFKFTEHGAVTIRIARPDSSWSPANGRLGPAGEVMAFTITDTGIGIPPELQKSIFDAFAQGDGTTARQYGGTGLGLSISRELVQLLGGEIALASTLGEGSTFTVYLPSAYSDESDTPAPATRPSPVGRPSAPLASESEALPPSPLPDRLPAVQLEGMKVLVVDDDFRNIYAITVLLERGDLTVVSAESGTEAIAVLEQTPDIDIVLVDIMMPVIDGYETMRTMRALPVHSDVPIIALTAKTGVGERERCIEAGATAYIAKPVENGPEFLLDIGQCLAAAPPAPPPSEAVH